MLAAVEVLITSLIRPALWIIFAATTLPLTIGVIARLFFFKRDEDDSGKTNLPPAPAASGFDEPVGPEPKLQNQVPWEEPSQPGSTF